MHWRYRSEDNRPAISFIMRYYARRSIAIGSFTQLIVAHGVSSAPSRSRTTWEGTNSVRKLEVMKQIGRWLIAPFSGLIAPVVGTRMQVPLALLHCVAVARDASASSVAGASVRRPRLARSSDGGRDSSLDDCRADAPDTE